MKRLEDRLQINCVKWMKLQHPNIVIHHSPNGGFRTKAEAGIFKAMGTLAGFPDLLILKPNSEYNALFIELKSPKGRQFDTQKAFEQKCIEFNYRYVICRSLEEFMTEVNNYLKTN